MTTRHTYSIDEIKSMLIDRIDGVVAQYAPPAEGSYTDKGNYFTLNPGRADRRVGSFCIKMRGPKAGTWVDYAVGSRPGEGFGDILDLIALSLGCDNKGALREARLFLGLQSDSPADIARRKKSAEDAARRRKEAEKKDQDKKQRRQKAAVAIWLSGQQRLRDTPVDHYLRDARGINMADLNRQPGVLRYIPDCSYQHFDNQTGEVIEGSYPAMAAIVSNVRGESVAVHRTYLQRGSDGRWRKAAVPAAKKVLGDYKGAAINLWKGIGPRGGKPVSLRNAPAGTHVFIAEGIEDAMSAVMLCPDARVLAAISLSNLGQVELPETVSDVTLIADLDENDTAREQLRRAVAAHQKKGRRVRLFQNKWGGKDLNDALIAARENTGEGENGN